jgi:hypothetical protein|tara:strand:- start:12900 stop:13649 length:750 start_codon:yes stop_codon:yes gene_type:complete
MMMGDKHILTWTIPETETKYRNGRYQFNYHDHTRKGVGVESVEVKKHVSERNVFRDEEFWSLSGNDLKDTDIQCMLGCRVVKLEKNINYDDGVHRHGQSMSASQIPSKITAQTQVPYYQRKSNHFLDSKEGLALSVVYLSRKDGKICNDIYTTWCHETGLPFPDQLKHTALEDDVAMSEQKHRAGTKSYFQEGYLSLFDVFRNKKILGWFLPFSTWGTRQGFKTFKSAFKTTYLRPRKLNTWKRRRERR